MPYRLTRAAADDIADIFAAGVKMFGLAQADHYHTGIETALAFLDNYPRAARLRHEIEPPVRAYPYKAHLLVYDLDNDIVVVLRVRHGREDWMNSSE